MLSVDQTEDKEALPLLLKAASQGHAGAQAAMAAILIHGQDRDISVGEILARKSAKQGYSAGQYILGLHYRLNGNINADGSPSFKPNNKKAFI